MEDYLAVAQKKLKQWIPKNEKEMAWFIKFRNPEEILKKHPTFLYLECVYYVLAFLTFCHAMKSGGRFRWMWFATVAHGVMVELVSYFVPDIDNFWHAQSMVMLFGQRLPLYIVCLYPVFIYTSCAAVAHMNIRWWAQPFAVGLSVVLLDIPYDILGVKLLHWTWHDDDPNIYDRHYWVPWTSYYFHASFASSFAFFFFGMKKVLCSYGPKMESSGFLKELLILIWTGIFSMPFGIVQFIPVYHPLHDTLGIHSEVCTLMLLAVYILIVWSADRTPYESARQAGAKFSTLALTVLLHFAFYIFLVFTAKPEQIRAEGLHQPVGNCDVNVRVLTPYGQVLNKTKYLCMDKYSEDYFDFRCVKKKPANGTEWYTICGTPFENHPEYILVICGFCTLGLIWFWQLLFRSGPQPRTKRIHSKQHRD